MLKTLVEYTITILVMIIATRLLALIGMDIKCYELVAFYALIYTIGNKHGI